MSKIHLGDNPNAATDGGYQWTYLLHFLLPDLEQEAYYVAIGGPKFTTDLYASEAAWASVNKISLSAWLCPSDVIGDNSFVRDASGVYKYPKTNYLGVFSGLNDGDGAYSATNAPYPLVSTRHAVFCYGKGTPISDITDGTSNTIALAEYLKGVDSWDARGQPLSHRAGWQTLFVRLAPNSTSPDDIYGSVCPTGGTPDEPSMNLPCTGDSTNNGGNNYVGSRSRHPGGVNVVFCDGSVHFIADSIDSHAPVTATDTTPPGTWQRLGWMADGLNPGDY